MAGATRQPMAVVQLLGGRQRFLVRKPGESEGKCATVQRILADDRCALKLDGDAKESLVDPRPDTVIPVTLLRHAPGTQLSS